ncbi:MAG: Gfo/Idh/MocA family oxidoreductase [Betaproteobacteria bacterium]|nr:Gfo/Idh/MocA family oxidoreductase [Betaproteobacteria bacterium]MBI2224556.1 Gfo/Idh/MocA family oxidoreductase [Betaproteobacteria bacterium]MBI2289969.1 Gfo/Idh/MocA family oxidoreductase [Betaproteobacteria bacterium]MBI3055670.1 Gfo/Idh/MocA family oxidoreductase [Betaproteobacteria bacterium]
MPQHRQIGVAVVGAGRIGAMRAHLAAAHPAVRFLAVSDADPARARALADKTQARVSSADNLEVISHPEVDAVIVSTSEHEHTAPVLQALECGKAVLVEKPIALELEDASRILAALEASRGNLRVGYSRRFKRRYLTAKEQVKLGRVGKIVGISARLYNTRAQVYQMLNRNPGATPVVDSLTYYVDLLGWYAPDNPVVEVSAWGQAGTIRARGYDCDDVTWAILRLADGAIVNLGVSFAFPDHYPSLGYSGRFEILGTEGVLVIDDDHLDQLLCTEHGIPHIYVPDHTVNMAFLGSSAPGDWAEGDFWGPLASETRAWLDHLSTGRPCALTTAAEARNNLAVTLAIEHAVASGKPVKLSPAWASAAA